MKTIYAAAVHSVMANQVVEKGNVRNTVLRQVKALKKAQKLLGQGRDIKKDEIKEYQDKKPDKAEGLKEQVGIIEDGLKHLDKAIKELDKYKDTSVT
jgi:hypothetical protein